MSTHPSIRNINNVTTGDKVDFEILHGSGWKRMSMSATAINKIDGNRQRPRAEGFADNLDEIAKIVAAILDRDPMATEKPISSEDF